MVSGKREKREERNVVAAVSRAHRALSHKCLDFILRSVVRPRDTKQNSDKIGFTFQKDGSNCRTE